MSDIIINDPNNIIVNDGGSGGDSNILDVTWIVTTNYGPVGIDGDGNIVEGVTGIHSELDGVTTTEILDHIDNGGLIRYHIEELAPTGYEKWIVDLLPSDSIVCDGYYQFDMTDDYGFGIRPDGVGIAPYLKSVEKYGSNAVLFGADDRPFAINHFNRAVSSGILEDGVARSPFISQPIDENLIIRVIEEQDNVASNKVYFIAAGGDGGLPIIEEIPITVEDSPIDFSLGLSEFISRFISEYLDPASPHDGYSFISLNTSERENLTTILNNLDNTTLLNLNKRRISVWKDGDEDYDYQWMVLSPVSDGSYTLNDNFHFDCSYHCFSRKPSSNNVDISINITFTAVKNIGQGYSVSYVDAKIGGFAFRQEE